jgi:hypothetical protein
VGELDEPIIHRLDLIQATLRIAFEPQLSALRDELRADDVAVAVLDHASDWVASAALQKTVSKATGKTTRTVLNRLPELVAKGALEVRGTGQRPEYRRTGLV